MSTPRSPFRPLLALVALAALLFGACAGRRRRPPSPVPSASPSAAVATAAPTSASPSPAPAAVYPANVIDDEGTAVWIPAEPQKIVSITPANTEILYAIGAGDRVVAVDDGSDYPDDPKLQALPDVATFGSVDVEKIVSLGADLVVAGGLDFNPAEAITQLRDLGIPVLVVYAPSVDGVYTDIELIGAAVGNAEEADGPDRHDEDRDGRHRGRGDGCGRRVGHQAAGLLRRRLHRRDRRDLRCGRGIVPRRDGRAARGRRHHRATR